MESECAECDGTGTETCDTCGGNGMCNHCHDGSCQDCSGSGEQDCSECDGAGTVETDDEEDV